MGSIYDAFPEDAVLLVVKSIVHPTEERIHEAWYAAHTRGWPEPSEHGRGWWLPNFHMGPKPEIEIAEHRTYTAFETRAAGEAFAAGPLTAFRCAFLLAYPHGQLEVDLEVTRTRIQMWNRALAIPPGDPPGPPHSTTTTTAPRPSLSR